MRLRPFALATAGALILTTFAVTPSVAAPPVDLVLHVHRPGLDGAASVTAQALNGRKGVSIGKPRPTPFGQQVKIRYPGKDRAEYLGFTIDNDSLLGDALRYVRAEDGHAEAWVVDGDPRVYDEPQPFDPASVTRRDGTAYVSVEELGRLLGLTHGYGRNGYVFDGHARNTIDILTIHSGRDYFEIAVDHNRVAANVTGNMLAFLTDLVFDDIDGFRGEDGRYHLSFGAIERLFQVRTLTIDGVDHLLRKQFVAHDTLRGGTPEAAGFDPARLSDLDTDMAGQVAAGFSGAAVIITSNGQVVKETAWGDAWKYATSTVDGVTRPAELLPESERIPVARGTLFDLASNSKMYATNYAIQRLVSQGRLDLDATLASQPGWECFVDEASVYTGKWTIGGPGGISQRHTGKHTITIRDILHHYGGLIPDPEYPNLSSAGELWYQTTDHRDRSGIIERICQTPLRYAPKTVFAYSDVDYMILGLLVEQITGQPLDEYLEAEFYGPLGLEDTMFNPLDHGVAPERIAGAELNGNTRDGHIDFGTHPDGTPVFIREQTLRGEVHDEKAFYSMAGVAGHAGLFSTTGDMAVLTQLMLNDGIHGSRQYFTREVIEEFVTPYHPNPANVDNSTIGLGWRLHSKTAAAYYYFNWGPSRDSFGHQGWTGTLTIIDPHHDMTITILTNMRHSPVVAPPNGFAAARMAMGNLVPASAHAYRALSWETASDRMGRVTG